MPDQSKPEGIDEGLVQSIMDKISGQAGNKASWPVMLFLLGLLVLVFSILGIKLALARRQAAELAAKLRKAEEVAKQEQEKVQLANNALDRETAQLAADAAQLQVEDLHQLLEAQRLAHEEKVREIKGVTSWDNLVIVDKRP